MIQLAQATTQPAVDVPKLLAQVNWADPSWDLFIILFAVLAAFLYGFSLGRDRIIVMMMGLYMALAVANSAPGLQSLSADVGLGELFAFRLTSFLVVFLVLFFLLSRSGLMRTLGAADSSVSWWQVVLFSVLHVGMLVSIIMSFLPAEALAQLAPLTQQVFAGEVSRFVWLTAPALAMLIIPASSKSA
ncbi:MAG: hypothetical protein HY974_03070 [Candidatus Kerfeldbacteria bacterium]|nr:hypothetical protein [Candidatus Kerfeldbacteria bacterium]